MKRPSCGYTLYELVIVLVIVAILLTAAVPLLTASFARQANQTVSLQLKSIINFTQEEAMRRGVSLQMCGATYNSDSYGNSTYLNNCATSNSWSKGVLSYFDLNSNGAYNSDERIMSYRFDYNSVVCVSSSNYPSPNACVAGNFNESSISLTFNADGTLSDGSHSKWYFTLGNSRFATNKYTQFSLNSYGIICNYHDFDGNLNQGC